MTTGEARTDTASQPQFPPGYANIYTFACFNALSFQMILGSPMVLYAKSLNASATTLGIIAGMLPLLTIFQIPAARFVDSFGYKRFVLSGWSVRTVFVGVMTLVPLTSSWLPPPSRLALVLMLLFLFNMSRGISSCGWLPWISAIIPAQGRGRYLTNEAAVSNVSSLAAFALAALILGREAAPDPWRFSVMFAFSTLCAMISLRFLARIPAEPRMVEFPHYSSRPRLRQMWSLPPFRKLMVVSVAWSLVNGGVMTFMVAYMKTSLAMPERQILLLVSLAFAGAAANQFYLAKLLDSHGSKPVLGLGLVFWTAILAGLTAVSGGLLPPSLILLGALTLGIGMASSMVNLAAVRLAMVAVPEQGRSHYFAVYSVIGSISLGTAPVLWGILIDVARELGLEEGGAGWLTPYSMLFGLLALLSLGALALSRMLEEAEAADLDEILRSVLEKSRLRFWLRAWFRTFPRG